MVLILFVICACANQPLNLRLSADPSDQPFDQNYTFHAYIKERTEQRTLPAYPIIITMSGGGTRATALAADVIRELRAYQRYGHPLTDDVIVVSGTSGGSFTATAFAVYANDPNAFDKFYKEFVVRQDKTSALAASLLPPWRWDYLATNRTAALADLLDDRLKLEHAKFGILSDPKSRGTRPFLILNSTDFGAGAPFVFNQTYFSLLCSDLNQYPLALAAAAAGAFPFLLSDVELKNHRDSPLRCPVEATPVPTSGPTRFAMIDQLRHERYEYDISHAFDSGADPPSSRPQVEWLHLFDGGLVDNMGIRSAADLFTEDTIKLLVRGAPEQKIPAMLHIMINARDNTQGAMDHLSGSPNWVEIAENVVFEPIDTTSDLSAWGIQNYMARLFACANKPDRPHQADCLQESDYPQTYRTVQIDFDLLDINDADMRALRDQASGAELLTQLDITDVQRVAIEKVAHVLLTTNPCFQQYVAKTHVVAPDGFNTANAHYCNELRPGIPTKPGPLPRLQRPTPNR